jgi:indole-3-glycerol phosphate synthase
MSVLERILADTRQAIAAREAAVPRARLEAGLVPADRDLVAALSGPGLALIAEIKARSPSRGALRPELDASAPGGASPEALAALAGVYDAHADALSVLTDTPHFGGAPARLGQVRALSRRPILAKDFFVSEYQVIEARALGADAILLMASVLDDAELERLLGLARGLGMEALVEVHDAAELDRVLDHTSARIVGVNARDLKTLRVDPEVFDRLGPRVRAAGRLFVAESGLHDRAAADHLRTLADATLVGTSLMLAPDPAAKLEALGWPRRG